MKRVFLNILATAMMMAAVSNDKKIFDTGTRTVPDYPTRRDLPCWDVNGAVIYAKDEKTAKKIRKETWFVAARNDCQTN